MSDTTVFDQMESAVRTYCRDFPAVFHRARNAQIEDLNRRVYIDFLSGAGALNYGHNNPAILERVIDYLREGGVIQSLDLHTTAKATFLEEFRDVILTPRALDYRVQFTGPTGTNAVEAAFKIGRKVTGRASIAAFTNGFHGVSLGALAATANPTHRAGAGVPLPHVVRLPYDGWHAGGSDTIGYARALFADPGSGVDLPAAFIVETVQGEGGLNAARPEWLRDLAALARELEALLIVDDIQAGCGRTGTFFSFEEAGIVPDVVCLSKSIGGIGLPMAINLIRPAIDLWKPGEHNGTFRGHNLAFVAASAALDYWRDSRFADALRSKTAFLDGRLTELIDRNRGTIVAVPGRGLMRGLAFRDDGLAKAISATAFALGLIVETCGGGKVLKLIPPLTIEDAVLAQGLDLLEAAVKQVMASANRVAA
jgi:diaminobutyrate-2-oxoglutarate transaminase